MSKKWLISVMATAMVFALGLGAGCSSSGDSSSSSSSSEPVQSSSSSSVAQATLSIDKATASVSEYETVQLTATAKNGEGDVIWTSSDNKIATVDSTGKVTGVKAGTATITATYGTCTATCTVTVTKAGTPVMTISAATINVNKDETKSVTVSTTVDEKEVDGVEYSWYLEDDSKDESDIASIQVSADGKTATFTGLKQGTETYQVYANVRGEDLFQTVTVKVVDNAITFSVANFDKGAEAYETDLYLAEEEGKVSSIKPAISVYHKQQLQNDVTLNFESSDESVAMMLANGAIYARKEGTATFTANVTIDGSEATLTLKVTVKRNEFKLADMQIETGRENVNAIDLSAANIQGTIASVKLDGKDVFGSFEDGTLTLDSAKLPYLTKDLGDNKALVIETEKAIYTANTGVYTLVIKTKDDFALMNSELGYKAETHTEDGTYLRWGGYYVLGNDIDMENTGIASMFSYNEMQALVAKHNIKFGGDKISINGDSYSDARYHGFFGVFDGKGHTLDNLKTNYWGGGIFACLGKDGVFKNTAFTNVELSGEAAIVCDALAGTIENVYVQIKKVSGNNDYIFNKNGAWAQTRIINCFVDLPETGAENTYIAVIHDGYNSIQGVYTVGAHKGLTVWSTGSGVKNVYGFCDSYQELAEKDFSSWTESGFWTVYNGVPVPNGFELSGDLEYKASATNVAIGGEVEITGKSIVLSLSNEMKDLGITLDGNKVIIPEDQSLIGKTIKVTVSNYFDSTDTTEVALSIVNLEKYAVGNEESRIGGDLNNADSEFDLSSVAESVTGEFVGAQLNGTTLNAAYADGKLKIDLSKVGNVYGNATIVATFHVKDGDKVTTEQQVAISVKLYRVITTADQLSNLANYMAMDGATATADIRLGADIDMKGVRAGLGTWNDAWTHKFAGSFDGQGHTISNTTQDTNKGLFCCLLSGSVVKNVTFMNVTLTGNGGFVATENGGTIENVFVYGEVKTLNGTTWAPSSLLVSKNIASGTIKNCVVILTASGQNNSHGGIIAGWNKGTASNNIAINLSGKNFHGIGSEGKANSEVQDAAGENNLVCKGWKEYFEKKASVEYGAWANDKIAAIIAQSKGVTAGKSEICIGDELALTAKDAGFVKSYALATAVDGVSVDDNGVVSVAETAAVGTTFTVVVTYLDDTTETIELKTAKKAKKVVAGSFGDIDDRTAENAVFDLTGKDIADGAELKHVYVNDVETTEYTADGKKVTIAASALKIGDNNVTIVFETETDRIEASATIFKASMIINTADDLDDFWKVAMGGDGKSVTKGIYDGEYILGANIEYNRTWITLFNWASVAGSSPKIANWNPDDCGFAGTFDGRGHYIAGLSFNEGGIAGMFGSIQVNGVVKNIAFTGITLTNQSLFGNLCGGTIENVYIQIDKLNKGYHPNGTGIVSSDSYGRARVNNVFIDVKETADNAKDQTDERTSVLGRWHDGYGVMNNVLLVTQGAKTYHAISTGQGAANDVKSYTTRADMAAATENWSIEGWSDIWTTDAEGLPIFKSVKSSATVAITNTIHTVAPGAEYQVEVNARGAVTYSVDNADCTITAKGLLTVPETIAANTKIIVTVKNVVSGETDTIELTVVNSKDVTLDKRTDVDVTKATEIDVTSLNLTEVEGATLNNNAVTVSFEDGKLTIPANTLGKGKDDWKNQTIVVIAKDDSGATVTLSVPVFAYQALESADLSNVGYHEGNDVYGYFRLTKDVDAMGWEGNGMYVEGTGWTVRLKGTFDGQNHVISNYTATTNRGLFCCNMGTIQNLVLKNATVQSGHRSGIVTCDNQPSCVVKNIVVEATLNGDGQSWCPTSAVVAKNAGTVLNCVVLYKGGNTNTAGNYQGLFAGWSTGKVENNVAIKLANNKILGVGENQKTTDASTEQMSDTNKIYDSAAAYLADKDNITADDWAADYLKALVADYVTIDGPKYAAKGSSAQYTVAKNFGCTWSLVDAVEGISIDTDGVLMIGADVTAESVTIKATDGLGNEKTLTVSIMASMTKSTFEDHEYDAGKNTGATIDVSSVAEGEVTLVSVTVNGSAVNATMADGKVTIANADLLLGPTANNVAIIVADGENAYEISGKITKVSLIIKTADDFINMRNVFEANVITANVSYGGYYVVDADIDLTGKTWNIFWNWTEEREKAGGWHQWKGGFVGTFDGRGHTISNYSSVDASGIFGILNKVGVVKNVAFDNVTLNAHQALFASMSSGMISNVYVHILQANSGNDTPNGWGLANVNGDSYGDTRWKNVFVQIDSSNTTDTSAKTTVFGSAHNGYGVLEDCYAITQGVNLYNALSTDNENYVTAGKAKGWNTLAEMKADTSIDWTAKIAAWNTDAGIEFWTVKDGVPMAKTTAALADKAAE